MNVTLLDKVYDGESMYDVCRDVSEAFVEDFTPALGTLPKDEYGFIQGSFRVHIVWTPDAEADAEAMRK
jgi:hypothetical protein